MNIIRNAPPTKYDTLPQGSICEIHSLDGLQAIYEQISNDEEHPVWIKKEEK